LSDLSTVAVAITQSVFYLCCLSYSAIRIDQLSC